MYWIEKHGKAIACGLALATAFPVAGIVWAREKKAELQLDITDDELQLELSGAPALPETDTPVAQSEAPEKETLKRTLKNQPEQADTVQSDGTSTVYVLPEEATAFVQNADPEEAETVTSSNVLAPAVSTEEAEPIRTEALDEAESAEMTAEARPEAQAVPKEEKAVVARPHTLATLPAYEKETHGVFTSAELDMEEADAPAEPEIKTMVSTSQLTTAVAPEEADTVKTDPLPEVKETPAVEEVKAPEEAEKPAEPAPAPEEVKQPAEEAPAPEEPKAPVEEAPEPEEPETPAAEEPEKPKADDKLDEPTTDEPLHNEAKPKRTLSPSQEVINTKIASIAEKSAGFMDGAWCTDVASAILQQAGVGDGTPFWPDEYVDRVGTGEYVGDPQPGNLIYYDQGGRGLDHIAIYLDEQCALHGNFTTPDSDGESKTVIGPVRLAGSTPQFVQVQD